MSNFNFGLNPLPVKKLMETTDQVAKHASELRTLLSCATHALRKSDSLWDRIYCEIPLQFENATGLFNEIRSFFVPPCNKQLLRFVAQEIRGESNCFAVINCISKERLLAACAAVMDSSPWPNEMLSGLFDATESYVSIVDSLPQFASGAPFLKDSSMTGLMTYVQQRSLMTSSL